MARYPTPRAEDLLIKTLGAPTIPSPLHLSTTAGDLIPDYVPDDARVALDVEYKQGQPPGEVLGFEKAGPRQHIYFDPGKLRAGIVTCGGLCPGTNNVIRSLVLELWHGYGVHSISGFRYGYQGLSHADAKPPMELTPDTVRHIHQRGGTMLGSSRGAEPVALMADALIRRGIQLLFTIGGDGTLRGAHALAEEFERRKMPMAIVGIPKTIDNDLCFVDKTFGFDTAVDMARTVVDAAHTEALGAFNGIGLVKLMGRDSGFIAASATLASREVNLCLVPEVGFDLEGPSGLLAAVERRLTERDHILIVVAEGCAACLPGDSDVLDESGNRRYTTEGSDVGVRLRDIISKHLKSRGIPFTLKYIDPSYVIRGVPAHAGDSIFCDMLARHAAHAGMAGKTDMVIGRWHGVFTHLPTPLATAQRNRIDSDGSLWLAVTEATGQKPMHNRA